MVKVTKNPAMEAPAMTTDVAAEVSKLIDVLSNELAITKHVVTVSADLDVVAKQELLASANQVAVKAFAALEHVRESNREDLLRIASMATESTMQRWNALQKSLMTTWGNA